MTPLRDLSTQCQRWKDSGQVGTGGTYAREIKGHQRSKKRRKLMGVGEKGEREGLMVPIRTRDA